MKIGVCRSILRECRHLGRRWVPNPPASSLLWGHGFRAEDSSLPHPLLAEVAPPCLHDGLRSRRHTFTPWIRSSIRDELSSADSQTRLLERGDQVLRFLQDQGRVASCTSSSEEGGLRIEAVTGYVPHASNVGNGQYVFAYNMRFTNTGVRRLRVLARQYDFRDGSGAMSTQIRREQPEAAGVVGFTPLIEPNTSFEFGSGVVLRTPQGSAMGQFLVMVEPEVRAEDEQMHREMERAELMIRFVYFRGLETEQFHVPLAETKFDMAVQCAPATNPGAMWS